MNAKETMIFEFEHFHDAAQALIEIEETCAKDFPVKLDYFCAKNRHYVVARTGLNNHKLRKQISSILKKRKGAPTSEEVQDCLDLSSLKIIGNAGRILKRIYGRLI